MQDDDQESIIIPDKNGQKFICYLPKVEKEKSGMPVIQHNVSSMIVETEKRIKQKTPDELLEALKGPCFLRVSVWIISNGDLLITVHEVCGLDIWFFVSLI